MICLRAGNFYHNSVFAYPRGGGWWSCYVAEKHATGGYHTGERFLCRLKGTESEVRAKWDSQERRDAYLRG